MTAHRLVLGAIALLLFAYRGALAFFAYRSPLAAPLEETGRFLFEFACNVWVPLLGIGAGALIGLLRPGDPHARRAAFMFFASSLLPALDPRLIPDWLGRARAELAGLGAIVALPTSVVWFFLHYPQRSVIDRKAPWLKWLLPGMLVTLYLVVVVTYHASTAKTSALAAWLLAVLPDSRPGTLPNWMIFVAIGAAYGVAMTALGMHSGQARSEDERRRFRLLFLGVSCGTLPIFLMVLNDRLGWNLPMGLIALLVFLLGVFPLSFTYVVVTHRVFGLPVLLRRGLQYALVSRGFLVMASALIFWMLFAVVRRLVAGEAFERGPAASLFTAALTVGSVFGLQALNRRVLPLIDRSFFREAYDTRQILLGLSRTVRRLSGEPSRLLSTVGEQVRSALHPSGTTLYLGAEVDWPGVEPIPDLEAVTLEGRAFRPVQAAGALPVPRANLDAATASRWPASPIDGEPRTLTLPATEGEKTATARLLVPLAASGELLGLFALGEKLSEEPYSREDKELLLAVAEQLGIALENLRLARQVAEQETLRREVEIAREVQTRLLPKDCPPLRTLACVGSCRPARGVGGDYYDFLSLGEGRLGLALGDISGKGISAALLMSNLHALLRSYAPLRGTQIDLLMRDLSGRLYEATDAGRYATFFYGVFEEEPRRLTYVNAGHVPPLLVRPNGTSGPEVKKLTTGGMVLGLFPGPEYEQEAMTLRAGDALVVVSDGISEAEDPAGDMFGEERVARVVTANLHLSAQELHDRLLQEVAAFAAGRPAGDDSTLLVARVQ